MNDDWIYLDYNASTPMDPSVVEVMNEALESQAHPSSNHPHGKRAAHTVQKAREQVGLALQCAPEEVLFCSGSTEASNFVIKGTAFSPENRGKTLHFISSAVDHAATTEPLRFLRELGHEVTLLPVDKYGLLSPDQLEESLQDNTVLVSLIHGQNEVGTVQPLEAVGEICRRRKILFHVDASQSFGKVPVEVDSLKADFLNIAGHKIYGPKGVGALFVRKGRSLEPLLHGGGHEAGMRSGTPAPQLVAGLGEACRLVTRHGFVPAEPVDTLFALLTDELGEEIRRNGHPTERLPNVLHVTFLGCNGRALLNRAGVSASTGAACHSAAVSPVLQALGFSPEEALGSIRLSSGRYTSQDEARKAAQRLISAVRERASKEVAVS